MPNLVLGGVARNDDFLFRDQFVKDLWQTLKAQNVLLLAPRRTGKTSVMYRLLDQPEPDWVTMHLNAEVLDDPAEFFLALIDACHESAPDFLRQIISAGWSLLSGVWDRLESVQAFEFKVELRKAEQWHENWQQIAAQLFDRLARAGRPVLIVVDELPDMLNAIGEKSPDDLRKFLHLFRDLRTNSKYANVRWLVGGSVNLRGVLDEQGLINLVNDLHTLILPPFSADEVARFIDTTFRDLGIEYEPAIVPRVLDRLGEPIPYFLQLLANEVWILWRRKKQTITPELLDRVVDHALLGDVALDKFQHYHSRIRAHYPDTQREAAYRLLNELSRAPDGIRRAALHALFRDSLAARGVTLSASEESTRFNSLLTRLASDFYVQSGTDDRFDFSSRLLKQWWRKYYGYVLD